MQTMRGPQAGPDVTEQRVKLHVVYCGLLCMTFIPVMTQLRPTLRTAATILWT
jgi:hypothetical protein